MLFSVFLDKIQFGQRERWLQRSNLTFIESFPVSYVDFIYLFTFFFFYFFVLPNVVFLAMAFGQQDNETQTMQITGLHIHLCVYVLYLADTIMVG